MEKSVTKPQNIFPTKPSVKQPKRWPSFAVSPLAGMAKEAGSLVNSISTLVLSLGSDISRVGLKFDSRINAL